MECAKKLLGIRLTERETIVRKTRKEVLQLTLLPGERRQKDCSTDDGSLYAPPGGHTLAALLESTRQD
jgi:hypothetical protein